MKAAKQGLWAPAVLNAKTKRRLGDKWFSVAIALNLGAERKWSLKETYDDLKLTTTTWYDTPWVHFGVLSSQFNTPQLFVEAVKIGISGLDYDVPGDGTYLDETQRKNRELKISRTPQSVHDKFFKGFTWPRQTRSTPLTSFTPETSFTPGSSSVGRSAPRRRTWVAASTWASSAP